MTAGIRDVFDPEPASLALAAAWRSGARLTELPADVRPRTIDQGYDIQDRLIADLGLPIAGWKLGVGTPNQKRQSGIGRSIAGRILTPQVYGPGDTVPLPNGAPTTVELEIAYVLRRDIRPDDATFPISSAIAEVRVAFELVLSRFVDRRAVGWPSFAADNAAFQALILGERIDPHDVDELIRTLTVLADDSPQAHSLTGDDATDPLTALADLVAIGRERGLVLPKDSIISTGTVSAPFPITGPSVEVTATYLNRRLAFRTRAPS